MPWPNDDRPGYPADTETKQFHMFKIDNRESLGLWVPDGQFWSFGIAVTTPRAMVRDHRAEYLGPAQVRLTPDVSAETGVEDDPLSATAHKAMLLFQEYTEHHLNKSPPDMEKAARNQRMAEDLAKALGL